MQWLPRQNPMKDKDREMAPASVHIHHIYQRPDVLLTAIYTAGYPHHKYVQCRCMLCTIPSAYNPAVFVNRHPPHQENPSCFCLKETQLWSFASLIMHWSLFSPHSSLHHSNSPCSKATHLLKASFKLPSNFSGSLSQGDGFTFQDPQHSLLHRSLLCTAAGSAAAGAHVHEVGWGRLCQGKLPVQMVCCGRWLLQL